ncbi:MAG: hypothetical protein ACHQQQ_12950 [Bacteroidota bacterium]
MNRTFRQRLKFIRNSWNYRIEFLKWKINGKPLPPPHFVKQRTINEYRRKFSLDTLLESGTYLGEMVDAQRKYFQNIISIELSDDLYASAKNKFRAYQHIEILHGDSGMLIQELSKNLNKPVLFWLDGHYSGGNTSKTDVETPILTELNAILKSIHPHVILIDDARLFCGEHDYPTIEDLKQFIASIDKGYTLQDKDDIIRITKTG